MNKIEEINQLKSRLAELESEPVTFDVFDKWFIDNGFTDLGAISTDTHYQKIVDKYGTKLYVYVKTYDSKIVNAEWCLDDSNDGWIYDGDGSIQEFFNWYTSMPTVKKFKGTLKINQSFDIYSLEDKPECDPFEYFENSDYSWIVKEAK